MPSNIPSNIQPLISGSIYHVYNRAVGDEKLFRKEEDHFIWIENFKRYVLPFCELYAYCLLPNHYHLLLRINWDIDTACFSKAMSDAANSFCKWYNKEYDRKGSLFIRPFRFSSFPMFFSDKPTSLKRNFILDFFGNREELLKQHNLNANDTIVKLIAIE